MNVLVVLGHPEPKSFNAALAATAKRVFEAQGHAVRISDLYAQGFKSEVTREDFKTQRDPEMLNIIREQGNAWKTGGFADEIKREIDHIAWADLVIVQCPIWWFGLPAIVKGWMDRVFVPGFTYGRGKWYETGGLAGKRAMMSVTFDAKASAYTARGRYGDSDIMLWPIHTSLRFVGFDVLRPFIADQVSESAEARTKSLAAFEARLKAIGGETPMPFHTLDEFDENDMLKPGIKGRTAGQRD
ncbi:MAG: NAD(P)H-dependent oxidoreductase [Alphaproteobacteria bacterium]